MDDRIEPEPFGFRSYADDSVRHNAAEAVVEEHPVRVTDAWGPGLQIHYGAAARELEPTTTVQRRGRLGLFVGGAAAVCAAGFVGFLLARADFRAPTDHLGATTVSTATSPPVDLAQAAPPPASARAHANVEIPPPPPTPLARQGAGLRHPAVGRAPPIRSQPFRQNSDIAPPAVNSGGVRVFVHVADAAQIPEADRVRADLHDLRFGDQAVATPPVRFVPNPPRRTEVRCLKRVDCPAAGRVARYLAQTMGEPVPVVDLSREYEGDPRVRTGSLELWLRR